MKKLNKLLALLLALAMVFSLAACSSSDDDDDGGKKKDKSSKETTAAAEEKETEAEKEELSDEEKIVGEWLCQLDMADVMEEALSAGEGMEGVAPNKAFYLNVIFEFKSNGKMILTMEIDKSSSDAYLKALTDNMIDYFYEMAADQGMSKSDFDATVKSEYGMTMDAYVQQMVTELAESNLEGAGGTLTGYYKLDDKDGCIYIGETEDDVEEESEYAEYTFSGEKLKMTDFVEDGDSVGALGMEVYGIELPFVFEKQ